jgi:hypothetical protein
MIPSLYIICLGLGIVLGAIKIKFIIIYLLNVSDILFTLLLLQTGAFMEGNFFMRGLVKSEAFSLVVKLSIPMLLLYIIYKRIGAATEKQLAAGNTLINCCLAFYTLVNISHLVWIILYNTNII